MAKKKVVSSKTHTQKQLDDYANQNNPKSKAYKARQANGTLTTKAAKNAKAKNEAKKRAKLESEIGVLEPLDWMCYGNPYDFD